jgi:hypothetical protein
VLETKTGAAYCAIFFALISNCAMMIELLLGKAAAAAPALQNGQCCK